MTENVESIKYINKKIYKNNEIIFRCFRNKNGLSVQNILVNFLKEKME